MGQNSGSFSTWMLSTSKKDDKPYFKPKAKASKDNINAGTPNKGKTDSQPFRNRVVKYFKWLGRGDIEDQYPTK